MKHSGISRKQFRLDVPLEQILPESGRRRTWTALGTETGWSLPRLVRTKPVCWAIFAGWAAIACLSAFSFLDAGFVPVLAAAVLSSIIYLIIAFVATMPLAVHFPGKCQTVREGIQRIVDENYGSLAKEFRCADPDQTWAILKRILVESLGVSPEKVTPEARFVEDLNCG